MNMASLDFEKKDFTRMLGALLGMLILCVGINFFVVPAGLYNGGVLGLSQIIRTLLVRYGHMNFGSVDIAGIINMLFNIPLLLLAYFSISKKFFVQTLTCVLGQTIFLTLLPIPAVPIVKDALTGSIIGGIIVGAGIGISLRAGASSGGMDILGMYLTKKYHDFSVGKLTLGVNLVIYGLCAVLFDISVVIYCIIFAAVSTLIMDRTHTQNISTEVFILTKEDPQKIMNYILHGLVRGATYWEAKGGYTGEGTNIIFTMISKHELTYLKRELRKIDPQAFLVSKDDVDIDGNYLKHL